MKIFVSHSNKDKTFVKAIIDNLPKSYHSWIDERKIIAGENFENKITQAIIDDNTILVLFVSDHSVKSKWVQKELQLAKQNSIPIIPIILDNSAIELLPTWIKKIHHLKCYDQSDSQIYNTSNELTKHLSLWISKNDNADTNHLQDISEDIITEFAQETIKKGLADEATMVSFTPLLFINMAFKIRKWYSLYWDNEKSKLLSGKIPKGKDLEYFLFLDPVWGFHLQNFREVGFINKIALPHGNSETDVDIAWHKFMDYYMPEHILKDQNDILIPYLSEYFLKKGLVSTEIELPSEIIESIIELRIDAFTIGIHAYKFLNLGPIKSLQ